ncbi:MutS protein 1 [Friedmanniomyces endolithicus]|nr:MutS protein 1 [Friedmanniomyces endolithicus]
MGGGPAKEHVLCILPYPIPTSIKTELHKRFPNLNITYKEVSFTTDAEALRKEVSTATWHDVTILYTLFSFPEKLSDAPNLRLVQLASAGSNQIQKHPIFTSSDITITTNSGIHGPQIAEWCVMTALIQSHRYNTLHDLQKEHRWGKPAEKGEYDYHSVRDMVGRRLGVLGYGSIGRQVGRMAKAMGMDVVAFTATPKDTPEKKKDAGFIVPGTGDANGDIPSAWYSGLDKESLHHFLKQDIDWLVVSVPLTEQTKHFLSTAEFKALSQDGKKPAFIQNIARGPIIDQPALIEALKDGTIAAAALDVTDPEPLPKDSELWDMPNVTITPHVSGVGSSYAERSFELFKTNLERREKGERLLNVVRRDRGNKTNEPALRPRLDYMPSTGLDTKIDFTSVHVSVRSRDAQRTLAKVEGARSIATSKSTQTFYLSDWTHLGVRVDDSKLRIRTEEERVFSKLRAQVIENLMKLRRNAAVLDELDVACSSATVSKERNLVRPILNESTSHNIVGGRHPTVDVGLKEQGRPFTANDCAVGDHEKTYLITGANMAGKSTYLRQNALITILAQTGCFVPADYAAIGLVDKIFSRVGSADNLYQDQSTFMVEMLETAEILKQATPRSFVIMDEVGRGTTPEDGIAVGYAALHHLQYVNQCRTLFATHFHALADMTRDFEGLGCFCTDVAEEADGTWAYVHRLRRGVNRESHALKVARLAGMPESAIAVAGEVLADLHRASGGGPGRTSARADIENLGRLRAAAG